MKDSDKAYCRTCGGVIPFYTKPKFAILRGIKPAFCEPCLKVAIAEQEEEDNQQKRMIIHSRSGIPISYKELLKYKLKKMTTQSKAVAFFDKIKDVEPGVKLPYLYGPTGTGKTALAFAFARKCIFEKTLEVKYVNVPALIHSLRREKVSVEPTGKVLILDDIGAHVLSNWTLETLYNVIDTRLMKNLPTLITSNIPPYKLDSHIMEHMSGEVSKSLCNALSDRIMLLTKPIAVNGESIRLKKALGD